MYRLRTRKGPSRDQPNFTVRENSTGRWWKLYSWVCYVII